MFPRTDGRTDWTRMYVCTDGVPGFRGFSTKKNYIDHVFIHSYHIINKQDESNLESEEEEEEKSNSIFVVEHRRGKTDEV